MVRLKVGNKILHFDIYTDFNSSMVRLKAAFVVVYVVAGLGFQFLNGAIKSMVSLITFASFSYFNSSMVRLKAFIRAISALYCSISIPQWCD